MLVERLGRQQRIAATLARQLTLARGGNAQGHRTARFAVGRGRQRGRCHHRHFDLQVEPIQKRAAEPSLVARHLIGRATAGAQRVAQMAAWAGIHRRDQLETGREQGLTRGARDQDLAALHRLAQGFQRRAVELGQFVEKQHAMQGQ